jgi:hypothetical protein
MRRVLVTVLCGVVCSGVLYADVRTEEKTQVKFEGMLGRIMGIFGGRAARDGITTTVAVKGDRKSTTSGDTQQIIDLKEEKIYFVDLKAKSYKVTTFAELRQQMEEARRKAAEQQLKETGKADASAPQMDLDFSLKDTGQRKVINGFDTHEVLMTITMREKGKTLEQSGGIVLSSSTWLAPKMPGGSEVLEFDKRYAQKLAASGMLDAQQMAAISAMYPQMQQAMTRMQAENVNLDGTSVLTEVKFEIVASAEETAKAAQPEKKDAKKDDAPPTSVSGLGGALGGRLGRRILAGKDKEAPEAAAAPATPGRATLMTMHHELLKVTPEATDADVSIPAGFKQK